MNKEQLMNKVNKLLALAGNNPSQEEANAALAKAQALIAEYNLNMDEFSDKEDIVMLTAEHQYNKAFRTAMAHVLAKNFRCELIMHGNTCAFVGYKTDAEICVKAFNYAYKVCLKEAIRRETAERKLYGRAPGVLNSYAAGFIAGMKEVLDEQCRALMIVVPDEVTSNRDSRASGKYRGGRMIMNGYDRRSYDSGKIDGRSHMEQKKVSS